MTTLQCAVPPAGSQSGAGNVVEPSTRRARCLSAGTATVGASFSTAPASFGFAPVAASILVTRKTGLAGKRCTLTRRLLEYDSAASMASPGQVIFTTRSQLDPSGS